MHSICTSCEAGMGYSFRLYLLMLVVASFSGFSVANSDGKLRRYDDDNVRVKESNNFLVSEYNALYDLYNATDGPNWQWTASLGNPWTFAPDVNPCDDNWQGVACLPFNYTLYIVQLWLDDMGLKGTLPQSIVNLTYLEGLLMSDNELFGDLPATLADCTQLTYLALDENKYNTTFPEVLSRMPVLENLLLDGNSFHGPIPESFVITPSMVTLQLADNHFTGCPPLPVGYTSNLQYFHLYNNHFHCTLPEVYGGLSSLLLMEFTNNRFFGTIPASYGNLTTLVGLDVSYNMLTGSLPQSLSSPALTYYYVESNYLTGSVPDNLTSISTLQYMSIYDNFLTGSIPNDIGNLRSLLSLYAFDNLMTGTIPPSLGDCTGLYYLLLYNNLLTGTIPPSLGQLSQMLLFEVQDNQLSGPLPPELGGMAEMYFFVCDRNHLSGSIPEQYAAWTDTTIFLAGDNHLTGTFPTAVLTAMSGLSELDLSANRLSGTIPAELGTLTSLQYMNLFNCFLSGPLPDSLGNLAVLQYFFAYKNLLTGTIPESYGGMRSLEQLTLDLNLLSGTIPESIGAIRFLQYLFVEDNMLTGTLPRTLATAEYLLTFVASHNHFSGSLDGVFNATTNVKLLTIVLSNNQLSGTLPAELFRLPKLNSFSAVGNCFHGRLPEEVCGASVLVTLALDGLSTAPSCRDTLLPGLSASYVTHDSLAGTVPACLFHMPVLTTLHLSGNGLTGALPDMPLESFLLDLSLSHNALTGTIPPNMQRRKWYNLDLAYNRLSGSLLSDFQSKVLNESFFDQLSDIIGVDITRSNASSSLVLQANRISGRIPSVLQHQHHVSILGTNVFSCNVAESNLPQYDSGRDTYQCGSDSFNVPYYLWLALLGTALTFGWVLHRYQDAVQKRVGLDYALKHVYRWYFALEDFPQQLGGGRLRAYRRVLALGQALCGIGMWCALFMVMVLLPVYAACSHYRGTLLHQYAWALSAAYLTGWEPAILMLVLLTLLVAFAGYRILWTKRQMHSAVESAGAMSDLPTAAPSPQQESTVMVVLVYALFLTMNLVVVVGANTAYVVVAIYGARRALFPAQLALSLFKLLWNRFFSVYLIRWTARLKALVGEEMTSNLAEGEEAGQGSVDSSADSQFVSLQMFVALFNNIAVPCLVVMGVSPSCFYNVFVAAPEVTAVYTFETCAEVVGGSCDSFQSAQMGTSYSPPFTYSYQCSSSFVTYYAPTFVLLCLLRAFVSPLAQFTLYHLHRRATPGTRWRGVLDAALLPNLKSIVAGISARRDVFKPFFDANQLLLSLVNYTGLLLTYGAVFPPVALAILVTLLTVFHFNKLKANRFIRRAVEQEQMDYVDVVEAESARAGFLPVLERAAWMLVTVSCWFYTLFLFDTLGDAVGFEGAYWVLIVMPLMPAVLYGIYRVSLPCWRSPERAAMSCDVGPTKDRAGSGTDGMAQAAGMVELGRVGAVEPEREAEGAETFNALQHGSV